MPNVHLARLLAVVSTLAQGSWVKVPYHPIGGDLEANDAFMIAKDPSDGCVCVLHVMHTRSIGDIETPLRLDGASSWSLGEMLSYLVDLDEKTLASVDAGLEKVQLGGSDTLRALAVLCQQESGPYGERIAAENLTLTFDGDVPTLTAEGEAEWSLNATVMMIRQGR